MNVIFRSTSEIAQIFQRKTNIFKNKNTSTDNFIINFIKGVKFNHLNLHKEISELYNPCLKENY